MPNWCGNELYIRGEANDVKGFLDACKGQGPVYKLSEAEKKFYKEVKGDYVKPEEHDFTLNALVPVPKEILEVGYSQAGASSLGAIMGTEKAQDGYSWSIQNWGTKWDVNDPAITYAPGDEQAVLMFSTAWSPPAKWVANVAAQFPDLEFEIFFEEMGNCFAGNMVWSDGELQFNEEVEGYEEMKDFCIRNGMYDEDFFADMEDEGGEEE